MEQGTIMRHIWNMFANAGPLWVAWVKENVLKGRNFYQAKIPQNCFWSRRKIVGSFDNTF